MRTVFIAALVLMHSIASGQNMKEKNLTNSAGDDRYASYAPDGAQIIFESNRDGNWEIYSMDPNGKNQERLTTNNAEDRRPAWHPNGKKIIFESNRSGKYELYELHIRTKKIKKINIQDLDGEPIFAKFSPDGKKNAFSSKKSDNESTILIIDKKGEKIKTLVHHQFRSFYPNWSPDGKTLVFFSRHETNNKDDEIYTINSHGSKEKRITHWPKHNFCPSWSNNGKHIAYVTSMENSRSEIYIMDKDGKNPLRITYNNDGDTLPNWSPDDKKLLITAYRDGNYEICEVTLIQ